MWNETMARRDDVSDSERVEESRGSECTIPRPHWQASTPYSVVILE
jgi:hypothetical protein